jgi:multimeric flavodoxin WrbA
MILNPFLEGMKEAGAEVELFYTRKLKINPCLGEFQCWFQTPGKCLYNDDMAMLLPKLDEADIRVFATPLYADGVSGPMKDLMDRQIPSGIPFLEFRDGRCRHPMREGHKPGKIALVCSCGLWEMENFEAILTHMEVYCNNMVKEFAGALLRPHASAMKFVAAEGIDLSDIFEASKEAGRQLIQDGSMKKETLDILSRPIMPAEDFVNTLNDFMRQAMAAGERDQSIT